MQTLRNISLTIGGHDPSGGAGIGADIATFTAFGTLHMSVCTAITIQNEDTFSSIEWVSLPTILQQISIIFQKHTPEFIKIGIVENFETLLSIISHIHQQASSIKIIWDPILGASSGYTFHKSINKQLLKEVLQKTFLITPNIPECEHLFHTCNIQQLQNELAKVFQNNILLKGGHQDGMQRNDCLITPNEIHTFYGEDFRGYAKHGSGCVLSAAITAGLCKGLPLIKACEEAKNYIHKFLLSNPSKLGFHHIVS